MKLNLDKNKRKFIKIEVEFDGKKSTLEFYEKNTKQIDAIRNVAKNENSKLFAVDDKNKEQFFENLRGDKDVVDSIVEYYNDNGNLYDFINDCESELGKLKKRG